MKNVMVIVLVCVVSFFLGRVWNDRRLCGAEVLELPNLDNGFRPVEFPSTLRPFVFFIEVGKGGPLLEKTLQSLFFQHYENFRVILIVGEEWSVQDGCLNDELVEARADLSSRRITVMRCAEGVAQRERLAQAAGLCADEEIAVVMREGEILAHEWVLSRLNQYYADPDLYFTFCCLRETPSYRMAMIDLDFSELPLKTFLVRYFSSCEGEDKSFLNRLIQKGVHAVDSVRTAGDLFDNVQFIPEVMILVERDANGI